MMRLVCAILVGTFALTAQAAIPLSNAGIETNASGIFGGIDNWGPNGGWADHATFTIGQGRAYDPGLQNNFGFYSVNNSESVGQLTSVLIQANTTYTFASWGQGGGNDIGTMVYEIGYDDGGNFALLGSATYAVGREWQALAGASYTTGAAGPEIGKTLWVRLGPSDGGASPDDVWFDNFVATPEPATMALLAFGGLMSLRRRRA